MDGCCLPFAGVGRSSGCSGRISTPWSFVRSISGYHIRRWRRSRSLENQVEGLLAVHWHCGVTGRSNRFVRYPTSSSRPVALRDGPKKKSGAKHAPYGTLGMTTVAWRAMSGKTRRKSLRSRLRIAQARPELQDAGQHGVHGIPRATSLWARMLAPERRMGRPQFNSKPDSSGDLESPSE